MSRPEKAASRGQPPQIPGYRLEAVLGRGATGVVYRAVQLSIGRVVALKVLHPGAVRNVRAVRRLQREARTAARLAHPNIISAIDMGRTGDTWWFAMELVEGSSLAERLEHGGRLPERKALSIFIALCDALQHASEKGVVHRDVKPANILLELGGRPRLVDLGLARVEDDPMLTRTGATLGTPHYISPEQARDPASADVRSDIWSLGATFFHAVCGRPPFSGESAAELLSEVLYGRIPDPRDLRPELSRGLALVLRKCLSRDPERRYFTPAELKEDLERVRDHRAPAIRKSALEPLGERGSGGRLPAVAGAVAALSAVALALLFLRPWKPGGSDAPADAFPGSWPALDALVGDLDSGRIRLAAAWAARIELCAEPPPEFRVACLKLQTELSRRLEIAMDELKGELAREVDALLRERRFVELDRLLERGVWAEVEERTGFVESELPVRFAGYVQNIVGRHREQLERSRAGALESLARALDTRLDLLDQLAISLARQGRYDDALAGFEREPEALFEEAGADARGLAGEALEARLELVRERLRVGAERVRRSYGQLDLELLQWAEESARVHEERLRRREVLHASDSYARGFERELEVRGLALGRLPAGPADRPLVRRAPQRFEERRAELELLERELLAADAERRFDALEAEAAEPMRAREYERAAALWRARRGEPVLAPLTQMIDMRVEEADELASFLRTAAAGVAASDGTEIAIPVGSMTLPGRLETSRDPLQRGFRLVYKPGTFDAFCLRRCEGGNPPQKLLEPRAVELFARAGAADPDGPELALQRALFRYHSGDLDAARELLLAHELSDDDYLVYDLRLRLEVERDREATARSERARYARALYRSLVSRELESDPRKEQRKVFEALGDFSEFYGPDELAELRELKRVLAGGLPPATAADFRSAFGARSVELTGLARVLMEFDFSRPDAGAWTAGDWTCDGVGWIRPEIVGSDEELLSAPSPTLALNDPFVPAGGPVEVTLRFEQPLDSPPTLLVLSACGFHAVFVRDPASGRSSCLVDAQDLAQVITRARGGEGATFAGFQPGSRHEIALQLNPDAGRYSLRVDGVSVPPALRRQYAARRGNSVTLRSLEPVRLLSVTVKGSRR